MKRSLCLLLFLGSLFSWAKAQDNSMAIADSLSDAAKFKEAIAEYNKVLSKDPKNEMALRGRAYAYYHTDEYVKTEEDYRAALDINPKCTPCYSKLVDMRNFLGQKEQALKLADSCIILYKDHKDLGTFKLQKAYLLSDKQDDAAAELLFDEVVKQYPDSAKVYFYRADFRYRTDSKSGALKDIDKAIFLDDSVATFYTMKAKLYLTIEYIEPALQLTNKAIALDSSLTEAYWIRANIYSYYQKNEEAIADMQMVFTKDTTNWQYYSFLSDIYHNKENMDSMCWCDKKAMEIFKPQTLNANYESIINTFTHKISAFCDDNKPGYYYQRGVAMYNLGLYDSAVTYYTEGLKKFPAHPFLLNFRANAYLILKKWDEAQNDYFTSIADEAVLLESIKERFNDSSNISPDIYVKGFVSSAYSSLSEVFMYKQKYAKALEMADSSITLAPLVPDIPLYLYYNQKGRVLMAQGLYDDAFETFEKCKMLNPDGALGYMNMSLALANKALNNKEKYAVFSISGNNNSLFGFDYKSKPIKLTDTKKRLLKEAITYCDMAVNSNSENAQAYLVRGYIKHLLGNSTACEDVRQAMYLGNSDAAAYYQSICR